MAELLAEHGSLRFLKLSAVASGMKELRAVIEQARAALTDTGDLFSKPAKGALLFIDEIHRWNKAQQDALLPHVEDGTVTLVGATTENPAFSVIPPLRSRTWLLQLHALEPPELSHLLARALACPERGLGPEAPEAEEGALNLIAEASSGDARRALGVLERAVGSLSEGAPLTKAHIAQVLGSRDLLHERTGDAHYDVVSALVKSLRGSDPDAALYWMARMLEGGEDPMFVARRLVIFASEDVGNADPRALQIAVNAMQAVHMIGMPEARIILGQAATWLATCPKSNASYTAINKALSTVRQTGPLPVPPHLRNAPTDLAKRLGHGDGYQYPHDHPTGFVAQQYLPDELLGTRFYEPTTHGAEKTIRERLAWWKSQG
jgi:putative ATPase